MCIFKKTWLVLSENMHIILPFLKVIWAISIKKENTSMVVLKNPFSGTEKSAQRKNHAYSK